jgi:hypothetical protein
MGNVDALATAIAKGNRVLVSDPGVPDAASIREAMAGHHDGLGKISDHG